MRRTIFVEGAYIAASGGFISIAVAIGMSVWRAREAKTRRDLWLGALGDAARDSRRPACSDRTAWCSASSSDDYLRHDGPEHVLCFAPTRSGKGVGLVVPTLLTWPGSCIVHDIKGENWDADRRLSRPASAACCCSIRPTPQVAAYNPLLEVRRGEWEVRDVQNIADVLVDPEGALERRNHWEKTSHSLLVGAILHVLYAETGQDARRRRQLPVRSEAPDRDDAARDDDDAASRRSRRRIPSSPPRRASC